MATEPAVVVSDEERILAFEKWVLTPPPPPPPVLFDRASVLARIQKALARQTGRKYNSHLLPAVKVLYAFMENPGWLTSAQLKGPKIRSTSSVNHLLRDLREAGLVQMNKQSYDTWYTLTPWGARWLLAVVKGEAVPEKE